MIKDYDKLKKPTNYWLGCYGRVGEFIHFSTFIWHFTLLGVLFIYYMKTEKREKEAKYVK